MKRHIFRQNNFNFISFWSEIMSLKSDQLELGFSIYGKTLNVNDLGTWFVALVC